MRKEVGILAYISFLYLNISHIEFQSVIYKTVTSKLFLIIFTAITHSCLKNFKNFVDMI